MKYILLKCLRGKSFRWRKEKGFSLQLLATENFCQLNLSGISGIAIFYFWNIIYNWVHFEMKILLYKSTFYIFISCRDKSESHICTFYSVNKAFVRTRKLRQLWSLLRHAWQTFESNLNHTWSLLEA